MIQYFFVIIFLALAFAIYRFKKLEYLVKHIPGPPTFPLIGNGLLSVNKTPEELYLAMERLRKEYGSFFRVFLGPKLFIVLTDPKDVESVLSSQNLIEKSEEYDFMKAWLGTGLLISTGQKWFQRRKVLTPAFHFKILEQFVDVFNENSEILVEKLSKFEGTEFDIFPMITLCALDVICQTSMGSSVNAQKHSDSEYVKAVQGVSGIISKRQFNIVFRTNLIFNLSPLYWEQKRYLKTLHSFTDKIIVARREELLKSQVGQPGNEDKIEDAVGVKAKMALLDVLLQSTINGQPLSNADIREEVDTFMFEGHDTTTSGIAFCLYNLAKYPEEQQRTFNEIRNILGDDREKVLTLRDLNDLNYLEIVIKESLRLYPSVPLIGRKTRNEFYLNGKFVPKGASVGIAVGFMARDPSLFKDPDTFKPERFLLEKDAQDAFAYVPFSAGPRNCIGQKFAMLEMKSIISKILRRFELTLGENYEPTLVAEMILRPSNGVIVKITPRNYTQN